MINKCIINCAVTGAIHVPSMSPHLPITPKEITEEALDAAQAGAATVHLHARAPETGQPDSNPALFRIFCKEVHEKSDNDYVWSVLAAGRHEFSLGTVGAIMGGSVRVGLEDNLYLKKGVLAESNAEMVAKMKRILSEFNIDTATPDETRRILGLKGKENTKF